MKNPIFIIFITLLLISCTAEDNKSDAVREIYYFDLKSYFDKEAEKLNAKNPLISKSIAHNNAVEKKELKINDWTKELALFIESDINKTSWKESYSKDSLTNKLIYKAKDRNLKTQLIEINFSKDKPVKFKVVNKTHNYLYKTDEVLEYFPDSLYVINKKQEVVLLKHNHYLIKGIIKK